MKGSAHKVFRFNYPSVGYIRNQTDNGSRWPIPWWIVNKGYLNRWVQSAAKTPNENIGRESQFSFRGRLLSTLGDVIDCLWWRRYWKELAQGSSKCKKCDLFHFHGPLQFAETFPIKTGFMIPRLLMRKLSCMEVRWYPASHGWSTSESTSSASYAHTSTQLTFMKDLAYLCNQSIRGIKACELSLTLRIWSPIASNRERELCYAFMCLNCPGVFSKSVVNAVEKEQTSKLT